MRKVTCKPQLMVLLILLLCEHILALYWYHVWSFFALAKSSENTLKFDHWSKHQSATHFIDSHLVFVCLLAHSATAFVIACKDA